MQKIMFPMEYLRVTQGRNIGSHLGAKAMDFGGKDGGQDKVYAPCDCRIVRVRRGGDSGEVFLESTEPVLFADGTQDYANFTFIHDNVFNSNVIEGNTLKQGEHFYDEGGKSGGVPKLANHLHLEAGKGKFGVTVPKQVQNAYGSWYSPYNPQNLEDVFFLSKDTIVTGAGGYNWKTIDEEVKTMAMSSKPVKMKIGFMSGGDLKEMVVLLDSKQIAYTEVQLGYIETAEVSKGDQIPIIQLAESKGVEYVPACGSAPNLQPQIDALIEENQKAKQELAKAQVYSENLNAQYTAKLEELNSANDLIQSLRDEYNAVLEDRQSLSTQIAALEQRIAELQKEIEQLKNQQPEPDPEHKGIIITIIEAILSLFKGDEGND